MPDSTLETELFEDLAVLIAALEAAHGRSERLGVSVDAHDPVQLALTLGGVEALLELADRHYQRVRSAARTLAAQGTGAWASSCDRLSLEAAAVGSRALSPHCAACVPRRSRAQVK